MTYNIPVEKVNQSRLENIDFSQIPFGRVFSDHMFITEYKEGAWVNPRIVPFERFSMHPASMVLHYGQAIFEGMKASKSAHGKPLLFRPEMHSQRLNNSARRMCMPELPEDLFLQALHTLIDLDQGWIPPAKGSALYVRPYMFANDEFIGVRPAENYTFIIFTGPVGPYYTKPVRLLAEQTYVRAVPGGTGEAKAAGNYAGSLLPAKLAQEKGFDQVMWLDGNEFKYVQEVGTMNIFFVIDGKVVTPATDGAILKGITRDSFLQLLEHHGYDVEVRPVTIDELVEAHKSGSITEAFGAGTAAVVSHIAEIQIGDYSVTLPPVADRKVGSWLKETIDGLRAGTAEDPFNWVTPVVVPALV